MDFENKTSISIYSYNKFFKIKILITFSKIGPTRIGSTRAETGVSSPIFMLRRYEPYTTKQQLI